MWQITLFRVLLILLIGIVMYQALLYMVALGASYRLRRKKPSDYWIISKRKIKRIYLLVLTGIILVGILVIRVYIQGI